MVLAAKWHDDEYYSLEYYGRVALGHTGPHGRAVVGQSMRNLRILEIQLAFLLDFDVHVSRAEFADRLALLRAEWSRLSVHVHV